MNTLIKKTMIDSSALIFLLFLVTGVILSQPKAAEEKSSDTRLKGITFQVRELKSTPSSLKMVEVHIEIFNQSRQSTVPANSIKVVMLPKKIEYLEGTSMAEFNPTQEEATLTVPLPPNTGRILTFGFSLPQKTPKSITFEIQLNPPEGEKKTVKWESGGN